MYSILSLEALMQEEPCVQIKMDSNTRKCDASQWRFTAPSPLARITWLSTIFKRCYIDLCNTALRIVVRRHGPFEPQLDASALEALPDSVFTCIIVLIINIRVYPSR